MSPEQAAAQPDLDGRSDIYSLGCCLYEMLVGTPPFSGPTSQVIAARHSLEQVPSLFIARQGVPEHVEASVMRALAKAPADRFRTAAEFADALNARISVTMPRVSGAIARLPSPPKRSRRMSVAVGIAAAVVAAVTITGWALHRTRPPAAGDLDLNAHRIAVTYFDDRSGGKLSYMADGLTEGLIDRLRGVHGLDVVSANASRAFRDASPDSVGRALGAGTLVQGSIEPVRGDSVRVTIRLVEGSSGVDFRRATFTDAVGGALRVRDGIADRAVTFLRERLGDEFRLQAQRTETASGSAWALVQRAALASRDAERLARNDSAATAVTRFAAADSMLGAAEALDGHWPEP